MAQIRMILIAVVVLVMGAIGFAQYSAMRTAKVAIETAGTQDGPGTEYAERDHEAPRQYSGQGGGQSGGALIKSTKTSSRVGGDKTITIQRKPPSLWMRIRMWFGYEPEDAHRAEFARLKAQREREAAGSAGVNTATGRRESTATTAATATGLKRQAMPNKSLSDALGK